MSEWANEWLVADAEMSNGISLGHRQTDPLGPCLSTAHRGLGPLYLYGNWQGE